MPGAILARLYAVYAAGVALLRPTAAPALPSADRDVGSAELVRRIVLVMFPPLILIIVVLGSIFAGIATPTESGALGAEGAILLAALNRRLTRQALRKTMEETAKLTTMVLLLLVGSTAFALVFRGLDGGFWIEDMLTNLPGGVTGFLIVANLSIFVRGFFIDFFEIAFIIVPLLIAPAAQLLAPMLGVPAAVAFVWFGVMVRMNLQTSFLTTPIRLRPFLSPWRGTRRCEDNAYLSGSCAIHRDPAPGFALAHPVSRAGAMGTLMRVAPYEMEPAALKAKAA